jgi:hypothetical protein
LVPMMDGMADAGALTTRVTCRPDQQRQEETEGEGHTTGLRRARSTRLPLSSSFWDSDLMANVVWCVRWFVDASTLTLCFAMTWRIISPSVVGRPSLPAVERSMTVSVNDSEIIGVWAAALMRCIGAAPQACPAGFVGAPAGASEGNAVSEATSMSVACDRAFRGLAGDSGVAGKGSGAPSSFI